MPNPGRGRGPVDSVADFRRAVYDDGMKSRLILLLFVAAVAAFWTGCTEDIPSGVTTIYGTVIDQTGAPIFDVRVGMTLSIRRVSQAPSGVLRGAAASLGAPYPNPAVDPEGTDVSIPVAAGSDTTGRVEIWGPTGGVVSRIATIFTGAIPAGGRTVPWNGRDQFDRPLPNGLYSVRLFLPAEATSSAGEYPVLISRTEALIAARDIYSAISDPDGNYVLDDLPVGERITETNAAGTVLGTGLVENRVVVFFDDPDYQGGPEVVIIGPGETVDVVTVLQGVNPFLAPVPGPLAAVAR